MQLVPILITSRTLSSIYALLLRHISYAYYYKVRGAYYYKVRGAYYYEVRGISVYIKVKPPFVFIRKTGAIRPVAPYPLVIIATYYLKIILVTPPLPPSLNYALLNNIRGMLAIPLIPLS